MPLLTVRDLYLRYRGPALLDGVQFVVEPGQRIGLLGRNGSGKTTLMRILCGQVQPDRGDVVLAPAARLAFLPQDVPQELHGTIRSIVLTGHPEHAAASESSWQADQKVDQILSRMELDGAARFEVLSSGMKRRVLLARCLVSDPDLLLLDEPTNHLDIDAVTWLEDFLSRWPAAFMFVTHDRMFLRKLATRILEIDRGRIFDWTCDYETFLERKAAALAAEERQNALFDKKLAEEEVWIRTGIKARRTRNEGRVRALEEMRRVRRERRDAVGKVQMEIQVAQRSGTLVINVEGVSFAYPPTPAPTAASSAAEASPVEKSARGTPILNNFSTTILRGDKVGIIGPNGAGKTTLLRILLGQLPPQQGTVRLGTNLQIAYFDQLRQQLDEEKSVQENVGEGYETLKIGNQSRHIIGYLQDFLFSPERARTPVRFLSGGERHRVLLAKLFAKPANLLVLDEPTNDLDTETLELLEELLVDYPGTILLVSHDREFLNHVVTSTIVFEERGVKEYDGGYDDWLRQRSASSGMAKGNGKEKATSPARAEPARPSSPPPAKKKLSYKEQQELNGLPARIEQLEKEIASMHEAMAQPDFYRQSGEQIASQSAKLKELEQQLTDAFARWEHLEQWAG